MRPSPLLAPPLTHDAYAQAARALREARRGLRFARRQLALSNKAAAAWWMADAAYLRATARAIRAGALHDTATHGWPYLAPQPALPPVPSDEHAPFLD